MSTQEMSGFETSVNIYEVQRTVSYCGVHVFSSIAGVQGHRRGAGVQLFLFGSKLVNVDPVACSPRVLFLAGLNSRRET